MTSRPHSQSLNASDGTAPPSERMTLQQSIELLYSWAQFNRTRRFTIYASITYNIKLVSVCRRTYACADECIDNQLKRICLLTHVDAFERLYATQRTISGSKIIQCFIA